MRGISAAGFVAANPNQIAINLDQTRYTAELPQLNADGAIEVFAFVDGNNNRAYDSGEPRTDGVTFIHVQQENALNRLTGLKRGWNRVEGLRAVSGTKFSNVNFVW
ncbi:hypothetical protein [Deinococcus radiophilus]